MEIDPASLDPEEKTNKMAAIASLSLSIISLCAAIVPICGGVTSLLGLLTGWYGMKSEYRTLGLIGTAVSALGMVITLVYTLFNLLFVAN